MTADVETCVLTCRSGTVPTVVALLEPLLVGRPGFLGCWTTELGALNQVMILFTSVSDDLVCPGHESGVERLDRGIWSVHGGFMPQPGRFGALWEWRIYDILPGCEEAVMALMNAAAPGRALISPLYTLMISRTGPIRLCHVWPYRDLAERAACRAQAIASGAWPPKGIQPLLGSMKSEIMIPTGYSPAC